MKTIKIKDSSELEQFYDKSRNLIEIEGNLECDGDIIAKYSFVVQVFSSKYDCQQAPQSHIPAEFRI